MGLVVEVRVAVSSSTCLCHSPVWSTSTWGKRRKRQVENRPNIHLLFTLVAGSPTRGNLFRCRRTMGNSRPPQLCQQRRRLVRNDACGRSPGHASRCRIYPKTSRSTSCTICLLTRLAFHQHTHVIVEFSRIFDPQPFIGAHRHAEFLSSPWNQGSAGRVSYVYEYNYPSYGDPGRIGVFFPSFRCSSLNHPVLRLGC